MILKRIALVSVFGTLVAAANAQVFFQDFESGLGANESVGGIFVINDTNPLNNGTMMMGHRDGSTDNEYSFYQVVLDLTGFTNVSMSFDYVGSFETHFDRFNVLATTGAINPPNGLLNPTAGSDMQYITDDHSHRVELGTVFYDTSTETGGQSGTARFDLSDFDNQIVTLRFQFGSDSSFTDDGFNMDNLTVNAEAVPEPATLAVLGAGALALLRRRKKASK